MAKTTGLGNRFYYQGVDVSGDVCAIKALASPMAPIEKTGINQSAYQRVGGLRDGNMEFKSHFNAVAAGSFQTIKTLPTTDVVLTWALSATAGDPCASMVAKLVTTDYERDDEGDFTYEVQAQANGYGLDWGTQMTAGLRTESAATNGAAVDFGTGSTAFGLQAFVHVTALSSGTPTIKLQESSDDDGDPDTWADVTGGTFGVVTAPSAARIETSRTQTVERYLRVVTTGTFSGLSFWVGVNRNGESTVF